MTKVPREAINLKVNGISTPKFLGFSLNVQLPPEHITNEAVEIPGKICFLFLPLVLNDSCGQYLSSKNVYTFKVVCLGMS